MTTTTPKPKRAPRSKPTGPREVPILFSDVMVRAILDGSKTETRRMRGLDDVNKAPGAWTLHQDGVTLGIYARDRYKGRIGSYFHSEQIEPGTISVCPVVRPWNPGDLLYVREAWGVGPACLDHEGPTLYRATVEQPPGWPSHRGPFAEMVRWRPSIHMHKTRARLWLRVASVRAERLQDITEAGAKAEGIAPRQDGAHVWFAGATHPIKGVPKTFYSAREAFRSLWDGINGEGSWAANPWVFVVAFERAERPSAEARPS